MAYQRAPRTEEEISQIMEIYEEDEREHGCGYWSVCLDHDCFCSMDAPVSQGFDIAIWDRMLDEKEVELAMLHEELRKSYQSEYDDDDEW